MQLAPAAATPPVRRRLSAAACLLLAAAPSVAGADAANPGTQLDATGLLYGENHFTQVVEPAVRVTRLFSNGQSVTGGLEFDSMTGASPSGAAPSGQVQTVTSPSGNVTTSRAGNLPAFSFRDARLGGDVAWTVPLGPLTLTPAVHASHEKDYRSLGGSGTLALDLFHHRLTLTGGGGLDRDRVDPVGGTVVGLTDGTLLTHDANPKRVTSAMAGLSQVITRRWIVGVNATRTLEHGYLTEPYKVISVLDPESGEPTGQLREKRPDDRTRTDALVSSTYHLTDDVVYTSYRYYWDDWGVRSHTADVKYRHELGHDAFVQPHLRLYGQTAANFFSFGLIDGAPLPTFASSDLRLGPLRTATIGATYGFRVPQVPGEWSVRAEWMHQWGGVHRAEAPGVQSTLDPFPPLEAGTLLLGYTIEF